jgi:two-component sensor histidine kinase
MPLSWIDKLEPAEKQKIRDAFERCIKEKMPLDVVFRDTINDESRYFHVYGKPFFDETGALLRIVGITADLTEMVRARMVLESALKEKEILLSEIHHRVKNNFTVITSLLGLHINNSSDPTLKNILIESRKRILSMALVHEKLYQNKTFSGISFDAYLNELLPLIKAGGEKTSESVQIQVNAAPVLVDIVKAVPLGLLVNELVSNSLKHAFKGGLFGTIQIELSASETDIVLIYRDDGKGFDFYGHLHSSETMGIVLINLLLRQLKAEHRLIKGKGFGLEIKIPLA